ncbi:hypothetical protein [Desulfofalx alkaliphila]|uniref:hypothetical protein n=1 Tax=Desulfofalx alkaliphila TaxID=105483 RepID=UPI0004E1ABA9|nr:hypothetical protein [Desulfofalx alkaliphila]
MEQTKGSDKPVLDRIELLLPPKLTLKLTALAFERGQTLNEVILEAIWDHIENNSNNFTN